MELAANADRVTESDLSAVVNFIGEVQGRARFDVADPARINLPLEASVVRLRNAREAPAPSLDREGFALVRHASAACHSEDMADLDRRYHAEVCGLIKDLLGAAVVVPQRSGLLVRRGERSKRPTWARPARFAHLDYSERSVPIFKSWMKDWEGVDAANYRRLVILQTWRATSSPPQDNTLALCDRRTLAADHAVPFDAVLDHTGEPGRQFESRVLKAGAEQQWWFWPDLRDDELLLFKAYDSDAVGASDVAHTAIDNPLAGLDAEPRESLEARFFAYFD